MAALLGVRALASAVAVLALVGCGSSAQEEDALPAPLTLEGLAGVTANATPDDVREAWDLPVEVVELVSGDVSVAAAPVCAGEQHALLLFAAGRLVELRFDAGTRTEEGVGNGSTRAEVRAAYGDRLRSLPSPYDKSLRLTGEGRSSIDFDFDDGGRVKRLRYGLRERRDPWIVEYADLRPQCPDGS